MIGNQNYLLERPIPPMQSVRVYVDYLTRNSITQSEQYINVNLGPKFNSDTEIRANVNQYNLKHTNDKGATPDKNRLGIPSKEATLPGINVEHTDHNKCYESVEEYDDVYEDTYSVTIDSGKYNLADDY